MTNPNPRSVKSALKSLFPAALAATLVCIPTYSQIQPKFQAADVHSSRKPINPTMIGGALKGERYELRYATMVDLISTAYGVAADKVAGGPSWLENDRFDIAAKAPAGTSTETLKLMLRALLADRFQLEVHNGTRPDPALALVVKGKHKLTEAAKGGEPGCRLQGINAPVRYELLVCRAVTMETFSQRLRGQSPEYLSVPVTDQTDLNGAWDLELKWTSRQQLQRAGADGISLFTALTNQLGLELQPTTMASPVLLVDRVLRTPTPNAPDVTQALPRALPTEFEVAVIKPSAPGTPQRIQLQPGGAEIKGTPLKFIVQIAYSDTARWLAGEPSFLDTTHYDISAKAFAAEATNPRIDPDRFSAMLRALLADRFKLVAHLEDREVQVYTLTASKPKLKPAEPSLRSGCKTGQPPFTENAVAGIREVSTCQNVTMQEFAERLLRIGGAYGVDTPVFDATGLQGSFDFTFGYGPVARPVAAANGDALAADPSGTTSLFDAVNQLGLKLEKQKHKMPTLVIDHIEEKPTEN